MTPEPTLAAVLRSIQPRRPSDDEPPIDKDCCATCFEAWRQAEDRRDWRVVHDARAYAEAERRQA